MSDTSFFDNLEMVRSTVTLDLPAGERLANVLAILEDPDVQREFFKNLQDPAWIAPLQHRGFFQDPPEQERLADGRIQYRKWPASEYLARMAGDAAQQVAEIFSAMRVDDWPVAQDLLNAAKAMPGEFAAGLAPKVAQAVRDGVLSQDYDLKDIGELCAALAQKGQPDAAMELLRAAFSVEAIHGRGRRGPRDHYWYTQTLREDVIPAFASVRPAALLQYLVDELKIAIETQEHAPPDPQKDDWSTIWRPAIQENQQNSDSEVAANLVGCLRLASELAIKEHRITLTDAIRILDGCDYLVFKRLRIHLIRIFADDNASLARKVLMNRDMLDDHRYKNEYAMLARAVFPMLSDEDKARFLDWIDDGPDMTDFDERVQRATGKQATEEDRRRRIDWWRFEKLHWIRRHLTAKHQRFYKEMHTSHGDPEFAYMDSYTRVRWGFESPFSAEELAKLDFADALKKVAAWEPDRPHRDEPSKEGLAGQFRQYVRGGASAFSTQAALMKGRPPIYVRAFIEAMRDAMKENEDIDLGSVLDLCKWVTDQPIEDTVTEARQRSSFIDETWQSARESICYLVREACEANVDHAHRLDLWDILVPLTRDEVKPYVFEEQLQADPRTADFAMISLNTPRSRAMHGVFAYARWLANAAAIEKDGRKVIEGGFDTHMREVRELLEAKLSPDDDSEFAVRATYGYHFGLLYWIDREWFEKWAHNICDLRKIETDPKTAYGWGAWNTFLFANRAHIEFYRILRWQFSYAVDQASNIAEKDPGDEKPFNHLGKHLMILYGRGDIDLETDEQVIQRLLTKAALSVRTHAIEFVGMSLRDRDETLPPEVLERFMKLWDWYWRAIGEKDAAKDPTSSTFGYWFSCGAFEAKWSLKRLSEFIEVVPKPEPDSLIVKRLAETADADIALTVSILERMIEGDDEHWRTVGWRKESKIILEKGMKAGGDVRRQSEAIIDSLGRRGFLEFGELLDVVG